MCLFSTKHMKELIDNSIKGEKLDAIPVMFFINYPFVSSVTGVSLRDYFFNPDIMMKAQHDTYQAIGLEPLYTADFGTIAECSSMGAKVVFDSHGYPSVEKIVDKSIFELAQLPPGDPQNDNYMKKALDTLIYMRDNALKGSVNHTLLIGPITAAATLIGIVEFCLELYDDLDSVKKLLIRVTDTIISFYKAQEEILGEAKVILISDDLSSLLNPELFMDIAIPAYKRIFKAFPNAERWLHNDADSAHIAELISKTGFDLWHFGSCLNMNEIREKVSGRLSLVGNLDPINEVRNLDETKLRSLVKDKIKIIKGDNKFILSAGGFINEGTPPKNLQIILEEAGIKHK